GPGGRPWSIPQARFGTVQSGLGPQPAQHDLYAGFRFGAAAATAAPPRDATAAAARRPGRQRGPARETQSDPLERSTGHQVADAQRQRRKDAAGQWPLEVPIGIY
ncbi:hypothetical protein, partial [Streptomyces sp. NPDC005969]|uniref:hypothetical protein n=1 Tax=Streptomyces sp. NPDC005969 TaxID=3156722 RepID=UPI0034043D5F